MTRPDRPDYPQYPQYPPAHGVLSAPAPAPAQPAPAQPQQPAVPAQPVPAVPIPSGGLATTAPPTAAEAAAARARAGQGIIGGRALAEGEVASAQTMPVAAAVALAGPNGPDGPNGRRGGTVYGSGDLDVRDAMPTGRQPGLHIGWHTASFSALAEMGVASPGTGLILGADHEKKPVPIRFFRAEPTRIALVGGVWSAQMIAFRALALGSQVVVMTADPQAWHGFGERAVSRQDGVLVVHGERAGAFSGTPRQPALVVHDFGINEPSAAPPPGPWQTQLTVLRRLAEPGVTALQRSDLLIMQRLHPTEAAIAESALRLTGQSTQLLQMMENEMLALIGGGANRYLWLHPTAVERQFFGDAWR